MTTLIPAVKERWKTLRDSIKLGSISVPTLEKTFGRLDTLEDNASELIILAQTGDGDVAVDVDTEEPGPDFKRLLSTGSTGSAGNEQNWQEVALLRLQDFATLSELRVTLPAVLKLRRQDLSSLFESDETRYLSFFIDSHIFVR